MAVAYNEERPERLRFASKTERRCIMRHALGYYSSLVVAGMYLLPDGASDLSQAVLFRALKHAISTHAILSAAIADSASEQPIFVRYSKLDLRDHVEMMQVSRLQKSQQSLSEPELCKNMLEHLHNERSKDVEIVPPWKVAILPLEKDEYGAIRTVVAFAYSHSHGDGMSGLAFHKSLLEGLCAAESSDCPYDSEPVFTVPANPLPPSVEEAGKLTISLPYLLGPLLGAYLPSFAATFLGLEASTAPAAKNPYRGREIFFNNESLTTGVELLEVQADVLTRVLRQCRRRDARLTGLLHQLIVRALGKTNQIDPLVSSFIATTAVDLRRLLQTTSDNDMANYASGDHEVLPRLHGSDWKGWMDNTQHDHVVWQAVRVTGARLAKRISSLHNQPIGLLYYLTNFQPWLTGKIGKPRDSSYELSNLMSFDANIKNATRWSIGSVMFSQPADATGSPMSFNTVSQKEGKLFLSLTWQLGALAVDDERKFTSHICALISGWLGELADKDSSL